MTTEQKYYNYIPNEDEKSVLTKFDELKDAIVNSLGASDRLIYRRENINIDNRIKSAIVNAFRGTRDPNAWIYWDLDDPRLVDFIRKIKLSEVLPYLQPVFPTLKNAPTVVFRYDDYDVDDDFVNDYDSHRNHYMSDNKHEYPHEYYEKRNYLYSDNFETEIYRRHRRHPHYDHDDQNGHQHHDHDFPDYDYDYDYDADDDHDHFNHSHHYRYYHF